MNEENILGMDLRNLMTPMKKGEVENKFGREIISLLGFLDRLRRNSRSGGGHPRLGTRWSRACKKKVIEGLPHFEANL